METLSLENQIQLDDDQQQYLDEIRQLLPAFIDLQNDSTAYLEEQINEVINLLKYRQKDYPMLDETVFKLIKERDHQLPVDSLKPMFKKIYEEFFQGYVYEQPKISVFFDNDQFPDIMVVKKFLADLEKKQNLNLNSNSNQIQNENQEIDIQEEISNIDLDLQKQASANLIQSKEVYNKIGEEIKSYQSNSYENNIQVLLTKIFNFFDGRIPKIFNSFLFFPTHLHNYFECFEEFYINPGPIPFEQVYFITIMTAAACENLYVYNLFMERFRRLGGKQTWIENGFEALPLKLQKVWELIWASLIHPTNLLKKSKELFSHLSQGETGEFWNNNEIAYIILIINFTINLVNVAQGFGLMQQDQLEFQGRFNIIDENIFQGSEKEKSDYSQSEQLESSQQMGQIQSEKIIFIKGENKQKNSSAKNSIAKTSSCNNEIISTKSSDELNNENQKYNNILQDSISTNTSPNLISVNQKDLLEKNCSITLIKNDGQNQENLEINCSENSTYNNSTNQNSSYSKTNEINYQKQIVTNEVIQFLNSNIQDEENLKKNENLRDVSSEDEFDGFEFEPVQKSHFSKYVCYSKFFSQCRSNKKTKDQLTEEEYNWNNHFQDYLNELGYSRLMQKLQNKVNHVQKMTNNDFGETKGIDTGKFRNCLWDYVEILQGYKKKQEIDYKTTSMLLNKKFKKYLRKLTNEPWNIQKSDIQKIPYAFQPKDYIHVAILAGECKFHTRLIYNFYCFDKFRQTSFI
ncbi:hypothetical protein PPERSA_12556 [Pseudocohnilembus persalinus]|uniref:Uncharacterized protein n=1 Tax=Pseudocohnilembus persalinus TaxID=266149 RepID=A0A0V0QCE6_PSEPJ|nr:hypothetical protein PPERSA_12556 [Pseudocohnilembus persalinus]|eukprot:KRW99880.1 hypothetical protein PPERSA_12556 [Pseudocohnilembus persalinus]